jgi:hypothetical protein
MKYGLWKVIGLSDSAVQVGSSKYYLARTTTCDDGVVGSLQPE